MFNYIKVHRNKPIPTLVSSTPPYHYNQCRVLSVNELAACSSFPLDYNWLNWKASKKAWAMGMSVPPFMIERIAIEINRQLLSKSKD
jgi:site-specific DNA-cytosine methylase